MRCRRYEKLLVLYLHGELADEERRRFERHLARCSTCRRELEAFQAVLDRAVERPAPVPSDGAIDEVRRAALVAVGHPGREVQRAFSGYRWYGARAGIVAAVCCIVLIMAVALVVSVTPRRASQVGHEPTVFLSEQPTLLSIGEESPIRTAVLPEGPDDLMVPILAPAGIEARLAGLETDTLYIEHQMAREVMPLFDKHMERVENAVFELGLELR